MFIYIRLLILTMTERSISVVKTNLFAKNSLEDVVERLLFDVGVDGLCADVVAAARAAVWTGTVEHMLLVTAAQSLLHHLLDPRLLHVGRVFDQLLAAVLACRTHVCR